MRVRILMMGWGLCFAQLVAAQLPLNSALQQTQKNEMARWTLSSATLSSSASAIDVLAHRFDFTISPEQGYLQACISTRFKTQALLDSLVFDLDNSLRVDSVHYHGQALTYQHHLDKKLAIRLPLSIAADVVDSVQIFYQGRPQETGFGGFVQRFRALPNRDSVAEVWTLSQPYGSRQWFPGQMDLADKIDHTVFALTVPLRYKAVANGLLQGVDTVSATQHRFIWQHQYPIANYLIAFAVTNFDTFFRKIPQISGDSLLFQNWVYPEQKAEMLQQSARFEPTFALFERLFGPYPFKNEAYGHAQFGFGGGMEHQSMSFMANLSGPLMAHELAHQWFGDKVTCGSWQDIWLNEGFASYLTGLYYQYVDTLYWRAWRVQVSNDALRAASGSVFVTDTTSVSRIFNGDLSYHKGAYLLHMLRWRLGDSALFLGMRRYLTDPNLAYGFARVVDFKRHLEATSGQDLTDFFDTWFYGQGYPSYTVNFCRNYGPLYVYQTTSHPSVRFFNMPLALTFRASSIGWDTTIVVNNSAQNGSPVQQYTLDIPSQKRWAIDTILIDPDIWLLSKNNRVNVSLCTSVDETTALSLVLSPNPATDQVTVYYEGDKNLTGQWTLYGAQGTVQQSGRLDLAARTTASFDVSSLPPGVYYWRCQTAKIVKTLKFIKI